MTVEQFLALQPTQRGYIRVFVDLEAAPLSEPLASAYRDIRSEVWPGRPDQAAAPQLQAEVFEEV